MLTYGRADPSLPALTSLNQLSVPLNGEGSLYTAPAPGQKASQTIKIGEIPPGAHFSESGLQAVLQTIVESYNRQDIFGVFVVPLSDEIDPATKVDYRAPSHRQLTLVIWVSEVGEMRVVNKSSPLRPSLRQRILDRSPLKPKTDSQPGSLLHRRALETYLWRLNDHAGRRVEASLTSTNEPGQVVLDYLVDQARPWTVMGQVSNTGTPATGRIRSRVSFTSNQTTAYDDVVSLDYFTTTFNGSQAVFASYERPLWFPNLLKARAFASWGNFNAQPVGIAFEGFSGANWSGGGELTSVIAKPLGVTAELVGGVRWQHFSVVSRTFGNSGDANLLLPYAGVNFRRHTDVVQFSSSAHVETNIPEVAGTHRRALENLGRLDTDAFWWSFRGDIGISVFVDALFNQQGTSRRLHELYASVRGQYVPPTYRVLPQELEVVGGFFSVRGYPESLSAADSAYAATLEYRFHLPRALKPRPDPRKIFGQPFRFRPRRRGDDTDWDLVFRTFGDVAQTFNNRIRIEEKNQTLASAGAGLELTAGRHINVRADAGYAFRTVATELETLAEKGSVRLHLIATLAW